MAQILIAEDEKALNQAYEMILTRAGHSVVCAFDGDEALDKAAEKEPDLILLDLRMPRMGGLQFLEKYQAKKEHPKGRIIVFRNLDMQKDIDKAYELGASKYMLKAWASPTELVSMVKEELKQKTR